jgi:hypothetical protein
VAGTPEALCNIGRLQLEEGYVVERAWADMAEKKRIGGPGEMRRAGSRAVGFCL